MDIKRLFVFITGILNIFAGIIIIFFHFDNTTDFIIGIMIFLLGIIELDGRLIKL